MLPERRKWRDVRPGVAGEDGIALVFAIFAVMVLMGLSALMVSRALTEARATGAARDRENAIHVGEAGADAVVAQVNAASDHVTAAPDGSAHVLDTTVVTTLAEEEAWAIGIARTDCTLISTGFGEACGIRPETPAPDSDPIDVIYGVGFVPSMADATRIRVVRLEYDRGVFSGAKAILTEGSLEIGGSAAVGGIAGNVHTNNDVIVTGNAVTVSGQITYTGSATGDTADGKVAPGPSPREDIPNVTARETYEELSEGHGSSLQWYDMCPPDGTYAVATARFPVDEIPCSNPVAAWEQGVDGREWHGWSYSEPGGIPTWKASGGGAGTLEDGIYYFYRANASIAGQGNDLGNGEPVRVTVIVEAEQHCTGLGGRTGNFDLQGNLHWKPALAGASVMADRDVVVQGNPSGSAEIEGVFVAREQIHVSGNMSWFGSIMAQDRCDTSGSPVSDNYVSGSINITYDGKAVVPVAGLIRVTAWNEL